MFKKIIFFLFIMFSVLMMGTNHPISMGILIIGQSVMIATIITMNFNLNWFSYLVFMIYLGGILMLFCYIISISFSTQPMAKFKNINYFVGIMLTLFILNEESFMELKNMKISVLITPLYSKNMNLTFFFLIMLFFVMTSVIFLTEVEKKASKIKNI